MIVLIIIVVGFLSYQFIKLLKEEIVESISEVSKAEVKLLDLLSKYRHREKYAHSWLSSRICNEFCIDIESVLKEIKNNR
mgnify:CR=1 FL=1